VIRAWLTANALYLALGALLAVSTFAGVQTLRLANAKTEIAQTNEKIEAANAKAEKAARETNASILDTIFAGADMYERGKSDAQAESDRVVAGLNAGTLKLRREWAMCETGRLADGAAATAELGEAERRRNESAGRIVRATDECVAEKAAVVATYNGVRDKINKGAPW